MFKKKEAKGKKKTKGKDKGEESSDDKNKPTPQQPKIINDPEPAPTREPSSTPDKPEEKEEGKDDTPGEKKKEDDTKSTSKADFRKRAEQTEKRVKREEKRRKEKKKEDVSSKSKSSRRTETEVDENVEIAELDAAKNDPNEPDDMFQKVYTLFPPSVYQSFSKLHQLARDVNTQIPPPEIVVLGTPESQKSVLLEALFGETFHTETELKRPLVLQFQSSTEAGDSAKVTLKRDSLLHGGELDRDKVVSVEDLSKDLSKRNSSKGNDPIYVTWEKGNTLNVTFLDLPSFHPDDEGEKLCIDYCRVPNRIIVAVEEAVEWGETKLVKLVKQVDPDLSRSIFVYTKFHQHLQHFTSLEDTNRYLGNMNPEAKTFFITLPSPKVRAKFKETDAFRKKVWQAYRRDMNALETLQFDKRFARNVGVQALRKYLHTKIWKAYQFAPPKILKATRERKQGSESRLATLRSQSSAPFDGPNLRTLANTYTVSFLQTLHRLIEGTAEGNPRVSGQTLKEEKKAQGSVEWTDAFNRVIPFDPKWNIPFHAHKLYGGQQFERLLAEFKAVCDHLEIQEITLDDVATATGVNRMNDVPNYAWAASDLAQHRSKDAFIPLVKQLSSRAVHIMKHVGEIAEKVLEGKEGSGLGGARTISVDDMSNYPYFRNHVKDLYNKFVNETSSKCSDKCMDEFYSTETVYWELTEFLEKKMLEKEKSSGGPEEAKAAVSKLAGELFKSIKDRITKNIMLKFYNFYLVPIQQELWREVQTKMNALSDEELNKYFQVDSLKDKVKEEEKKLEEEIKTCAGQEEQVLKYASQFSHPRVGAVAPKAKKGSK